MYMFYGDWQRICLATGKDGKNFTRTSNAHGQPDLLTGPWENMRDPMVLPHNGKYFVCTLPVAAPEIILHEGQYYIAALLPDIQGVRVAKLEWAPINKPSSD